MAEARRYAIAPQLDIEQILKEAQHRWLRPAEICEILKNYRNFRIAPEPPNRPPSGSLFLFDRKVLRYFRKDGHNWRKKRDGKTVKEAHERLKSGSVDVLHCYYAHGEENENLQRRSYWMLEEDFMHIVLVHYLEVKGGKSSSRIRGHDDTLQTARTDSPLSQLPSQTTEGESSLSGQASEYEETESADIYSGGTGYHPFSWTQQHENGGGPVMGASIQSSYVPASSIGNHQSFPATATTTDFYSHGQDECGLGIAVNGAHNQLDPSSLNGLVKPDQGVHQMAVPQIIDPSKQFPFTEVPGIESFTFDEVYSNGLSVKDADTVGTDDETLWQLPDAISSFPAEDSFQQNGRSLEEAINYPLLKTQSSSLSDILKDSFKKSDSFTRWMSRELGEVDDSQTKSSPGIYWNSEETDNIIEASSRDQLDQFTVAPVLAQDQLFSILDFSPSWTYAGSKTRVIITGRFLNYDEVHRCKWSCMFGEIEVPAEISADGILKCYSPSHKPGRVPFYVTCSNRLACSEVREFEFRPSNSQHMDGPTPHDAVNKTYLQMRLDDLLSLGPDAYQATVYNPTKEMIDLSKKISSLMTNNDSWSELLKLAGDNELATDDNQDQFFENRLKEKLHIWLVHKAGDGGKGPSVLDEEGQGVLHLAAALGYDWAIRPTISAGVSINFRDAHGWTALHWAAFCGRERTVVALIALGAAPGALTDPTPDFPTGSTPADLASANGYKGISGFLAESYLTSHLQTLDLKEAMGRNVSEIRGLPGIGDVTERRASPLTGEDLLAGSMGDSLGAVRNAAQAAARIYQVFRMQSFQRKHAVQYEDDNGAISDDRALSLLSVKPSKPGQLDPLHAAATRIQNKYRGWKGRKEFLLIRQRIVKIQAHVRGHQVRKHYRKIVWSVGIVEKVILRWRRRGAGLRGFRSSEGAVEGTSSSGSELIQNKPAEDDYDFLQQGRKQTEERLQKALARVKSMAQYPDARDQYQRILNVVTRIQESQAMQEKMLESSTDMDEGFVMSEFKELWDDGMPMPGYI
ncbi:unnamed protein product [Urochloa decumbens]|uniref:CG-1 domain-containing protein n=2 Tax=Urochloa decumbens TaxID=240449 RepID=A0ABC8XA91_9POAL